MNEELQQPQKSNSQSSSFFDGGSKTLFYTGLFLGVAGTLIIVMAYMLTGGFTTTSAKTATNPIPTVQQPVAGDDYLPPAGPVAAVDPNIDHIIGSDNAKVTLIEYSDFECPFCSRHLPSVKQALADFPNDVRLVYRHYPLTAIHPSAQKAAEASECVANLAGNDAFWNFHDKVFAAQATGLSAAVFKTIAGEIGVDQGAFDSCLDSGEMAALVAEHTATGNDAGVQGTPATFVNGSLISGAVPYATLRSAMEAAGAVN